MKHSSAAFGGLKYLKFFGKKEAEYLFRFLLTYWEGFILSKICCLAWVVCWIIFNSILNTKYWEPTKTTSLILLFNCCSKEFLWFESSQGQSRKDRSLASFSNTHLRSLVHFQIFSIMPRLPDLSNQLDKILDENTWYSWCYCGYSRSWWCWAVTAPMSVVMDRGWSI